MSYQATVSGYNINEEDYPTLDSIKINYPHKVITNTIIIEKPIIQKKKLITTSPSITAGYDPINKQWGMMIGISANLNIW